MQTTALRQEVFPALANSAKTLLACLVSTDRQIHVNLLPIIILKQCSNRAIKIKQEELSLQKCLLAQPCCINNSKASLQVLVLPVQLAIKIRTMQAKLQIIGKTTRYKHPS